MAITVTINDASVIFGSKRITLGEFTNSGTTGQLSTPNMTRVECLLIQHTGTAVVADHPVINETMPYEGSTPDIVTTSAKPGIYMAIGQ